MNIQTRCYDNYSLDANKAELLFYINIFPSSRPLPTELIKANMVMFCPILITIVNRSITSGTALQTFKEIVISPVIKRTNREPIL